MTFNPLDNPVDYILLANQRSPGLATISSADSPRRWDERRGFAMSGGRVVFRGIGISRPIVTLRLITTKHWDDWHAWRPLLQRPPIGTRAHALDIWHPILEDLEIGSVVIENILQPKQTADGEWSIDIKMIEHRVPVLALEPIEGSEERPDDPFDIIIEDLTGQAQALAGP